MNKKILLVDDDPLLNRMYHKRLVDDGYDVEISRNGEEALVAVKRKRPDLVILDLMMPKMNGAEFLEELKKDDSTKDIKVLIMTNLEDREGVNVEKLKKMGAFDYLVKSQVDLRTLSEKIRGIVGAS